VLDIGPGAGCMAAIVAQGAPAEIMKNPKSLTGKYLTGEIGSDPERKPPTGEPSRSAPAAAVW
jgi:excinuclease ABC subunit A